ncbi:uncharacterized protein LOC117174495 [Belonocnema kinseyi]|uniref:uncharacterized protein LOC117174495 n=1 Tax=Belonocnema kinseyi TaxID=2817044 RepID=UPI00143D9E73|nr:uncharacterized protein LOC117174495 [Belonocnema kinseyi]XP_033219563.1 uncharacterized protein LOC117174495 [Belonocnema kinseyi]XP_033219572.1 uncharacterized protein LOC117174495 [Belonocnema kinseyi]XP_033219581.1 uncharacterized protein LOC117174495 [Belonocnema kinseyi]
MRIEALSALVAVVWLTAILRPRLVAANNRTLNFSSHRPKEHHTGGHLSQWPEPQAEVAIKHMTYREMQNIIRQEGGEDGVPVDCCPTKEEVTQPVGGKNREDSYVTLYKDGENVQRFFEYSCRSDVLDKPCRFIDRKLKEQSRCVQKFSYSFAIIQSSEIKKGEHMRHHHEQQQFPAFLGSAASGSTWTLDYIRVRSGCSCEITPKPKKKKFAAMKVKKIRSKSRASRNDSSEK